MNKFIYFMAIGLAFTALQVATVEASHDQAHVDDMRATEDSERQTMRETEDNTRQTMRETEDTSRQAAREAEDTSRQTMRETEDTSRQTMREMEDNERQAARDQEDSERQQAEEAMNTAAGGGDGGPDCEAMGAPGSAARTACEAREGEHHEHDCSEIPEPEGKALCEKAKERGTPPTAAECAAMPTEEGRNNCLEHTGDKPGEPDLGPGGTG